MALVREMRIGGPGGAIVRIWDDECDSRHSPEEMAAMRGQVVRNMIAAQIARGETPRMRRLDIPKDIEILYERGGGAE